MESYRIWPWEGARTVYYVFKKQTTQLKDWVKDSSTLEKEHMNDQYALVKILDTINITEIEAAIPVTYKYTPIRTAEVLVVTPSSAWAS